MDTLIAPLQPVIAAPEQVPAIRPFNFDMKVLLTTEDTAGAGGPGTLVFIPRNTVHSFKNVGATPACMLDWTLPGGQDQYFKKISELAGGGSFTGDKLAELNKEHHTAFCSAR